MSIETHDYNIFNSDWSQIAMFLENSGMCVKVLSVVSLITLKSQFVLLTKSSRTNNKSVLFTIDKE